jgi:hypothetical protein
MGGCRGVVSAALVALACLTPRVVAQQQADAAAVGAPQSPEQIKQELEKIKRGRTLTAIYPTAGTDDSGGATLLRLENASAFNIIILVVGPTTQRILLEPEHIQTLTVEPGDYEIAAIVVGRNVPPFYGKQTIVGNMRFRHQFNVPAV